MTHGFEMREIYNGRTFPEYVHDGDKTVAVLKMKNRAGDSDYLYLPTDICSVSMMKDRLQVQELCGCRVEEVHNLRLPESLVPEPQELKSVGELTYFNEMCRAVCGFNAEKMERLAMAAEFVGSKKYTDITCVAKRLDEFEITPSVHSDEEYGCYEIFCLYSPLHGTLTVDGNEGEEELSGSDLVPYREEISRAILDDDCIGMEARGLMYYFSRDCGVAAKVVSAWPSVCDLDGELYGVLVCEVSEPLEENEVRVMKNYWTGQMSDGWGEGFEQHPIRVSDGEICVSFWDSAKYWNVMTAEELGIRQEEVMGMSL